MNGKFIYFDNANTTFPADEAIAAMNSIFASKLGNPSSHIHSAGVAAGKALDEARGKVAALINAPESSIVFTSGATEANNLAVSGFMKANPDHRLAVSEIEHFSIINQARRLKKDGREVSYLEVDNGGQVDLKQVESAVQAGPTLVSVSLANPEIGTVQDIETIGALCRKYGAVLHVDATAAASSIKIDINRLGAGLLTLSGHNMYAPMGIGALYIEPGLRVAPLWDGGNQEWGLRPGTENLPAAVAFGEACQLLSGNLITWIEKERSLGEKLRAGLARIPFLHFTGHPTLRLPGHVSFWVEHIEGESLLLMLNMNGVMASSGSACSSNLKGRDEEDLVASHVLTAVGVPTNICAGSITFSLGRYNTEDEVDYVLEVMPKIVDRLLAMSPSYSDYIRKKELSNG